MREAARTGCVPMTPRAKQDETKGTLNAVAVWHAVPVAQVKWDYSAYRWTCTSNPEAVDYNPTSGVHRPNYCDAYCKVWHRTEAKAQEHSTRLSKQARAAIAKATR